MLTYYRVCCAFLPPRAPDGKLGIYDLPWTLIHIFQMGSIGAYGFKKERD
jgi:hypothetical protein